MKYSEIRQHMVALRQCAILCEPSGIATAMKEAADFLESLIPVLEPTERRVLMVLQSVGEDYSLNFKGIAHRLEKEHQIMLTRNKVRDYCWMLKLKGLAVYRNGLFDETDGRTAGAGYSVTTEGMRFNVEKPAAP